MKSALIIGITGQDGIYTAELLIKKGYIVSGTSRDLENASKKIPLHLFNEIKIYEWDLICTKKFIQIIDKIEPIEIYNYASITTDSICPVNPAYLGLINGLSVPKILESICLTNKKIKFMQASSAEMFGNTNSKRQSELTEFNPNTPYGISKLYAHNMVNFYREKYGIFACSGILFNHESKLRPELYVTRKITMTACKIKCGIEDKLILGNLDIKRDWMHAKDAVKAMQIILQNNTPSDYVVASGRSTTIREFCKKTFDYLGLDYQNHIETSPSFVRNSESNVREGNILKLKKLGWEPKITLDQIIAEMVENDLSLIYEMKTN